VAKGEIVLYGIGRVEDGQLLRYLLGRSPGEVLSACQSEIAGELVNVHIDRHEEQRGIHAPQTEIDAVGRTHHPAEEQEQALAATRATGVGEEMGGTTASAAAPEPPRHAQGVAQRAKGTSQRCQIAQLRFEECA
jgi:hypothetical protein